MATFSAKNRGEKERKKEKIVFHNLSSKITPKWKKIGFLAFLVVSLLFKQSFLFSRN